MSTASSLYARKLAAAGKEITSAHHADLPHGFIQMTGHSERCREGTVELARLLGAALADKRA